MDENTFKLILSALSSTMEALVYLKKIREDLQQNQEWTDSQEQAWKDTLDKLNSSPQWQPRTQG